jgi:hypothetical protein
LSCAEYFAVTAFHLDEGFQLSTGLNLMAESIHQLGQLICSYQQLLQTVTILFSSLSAFNPGINPTSHSPCGISLVLSLVQISSPVSGSQSLQQIKNEFQEHDGLSGRNLKGKLLGAIET